MTDTVRFELTAAWTEIAAGPASVMLQTNSPAPVLIHAGTSAPGAGTDLGLLLFAAGQGMSIPALASGDRLYARAAPSHAASDIVVMRI